MFYFLLLALHLRGAAALFVSTASSPEACPQTCSSHSAMKRTKGHQLHDRMKAVAMAINHEAGA
ncbi:hypothetical protein JOB18_048024 [Solea senegalensis]|uniref:Secreted protein n=1 Tax=Solea senegalensis TaxID=28829 RepID=A0AAV6QY41_SOLSE|nr:hypothetical protein JOB18_048024 [Solea senegalensis]